MQDQEQSRDRDHWSGNLVLLLILVVLVGGGIWIVGALLDARKAQDCLGTGRRNCGTPIEVPVRAP